MIKRLSLLSLFLVGSLIHAEETKLEQAANWSKEKLISTTEFVISYSKKGIEPIKTAGIYFAGLTVCGIGVSMFCKMLQKVTPCHLCIDKIDPATTKNFFIRQAKIIPWAIAAACIIGYTTEIVKKKCSKKESTED